MTAFLTALGWALVHSLWQMALVGLAAAFLFKAAGPGRPRAQYLVACLSLAACLFLPVLTFFQGFASLPHPGLLESSGPGTFVAALPGPPQPAPALPWELRARALLEAHLPWVVGLWSLGVLVLALRLGGGWLTTLRWRRTSTGAPAPWEGRFQALAQALGARGRVALRACAGIATPMALGLFRPVVLVPAALFASLPESYLEALLAHELAHVARWDFLVNLLQSVMEVIGFHHPVVWWLSRRIRTAREHLCDDLAASAIGEPRRLALALDALDDLQPTLTPLALAARGGTLSIRIRRLLQSRTAEGAPWAVAPLVALLAPFAALTLRASGLEAPPIPVDPALVAQVDALAAREGLDPQLLRSIAWAESGFKPDAKSPIGALGLLQVMPGTARKYGATDLADPAQVAASGARYLKHLLDRYQGDLARAVTAYNSGEEALDSGKAGEEAQRYRVLVMDLLQKQAVRPAAPLGEGWVDGVLRRTGKNTWTIQARVSHRGNFTLEFLPADTPGAEPLARVRAGSTDAGPAPGWVQSNPVLRAPLPPGAAIRVRCVEETLGLRGEASLTLDGAWSSFAFQMRP